MPPVGFQAPLKIICHGPGVPRSAERSHPSKFNCCGIIAASRGSEIQMPEYPRFFLCSAWSLCRRFEKLKKFESRRFEMPISAVTAIRGSPATLKYVQMSCKRTQEYYVSRPIRYLISSSPKLPVVLSQRQKTAMRRKKDKASSKARSVMTRAFVSCRSFWASSFLRNLPETGLQFRRRYILPMAANGALR